jgi:hypothetical protein
MLSFVRSLRLIDKPVNYNNRNSLEPNSYSQFVKCSEAFSHPCPTRHMNDIGANRSGTHAET